MAGPQIVDFRYRPPGADPFGALEVIYDDGTTAVLDRDFIMGLIPNPAPTDKTEQTEQKSDEPRRVVARKPDQ